MVVCRVERILEEYVSAMDSRIELMVRCRNLVVWMMYRIGSDAMNERETNECQTIDWLTSELKV